MLSSVSITPSRLRGLLEWTVCCRLRTRFLFVHLLRGLGRSGSVVIAWRRGPCP